LLATDQVIIAKATAPLPPLQFGAMLPSGNDVSGTAVLDGAIKNM
jgi:hypothetical protein